MSLCPDPLFFFLHAQMDLFAPLTLVFSTKPPLKLLEGRGLNVTLGHQSYQPPARVSWGRHAKEPGNKREGTANGRETLALVPLSIAIGMSC